MKTERATGLLIAGGVTFFAGYGAVYGVGALVTTRLHLDGKSLETVDYYPLYIPFAGAFVGLATTSPTATEAAALITCGSVQIAGGALFLAGLLAEEKRLVKLGGVELWPSAQGVLGRF